mmetsp:Transcript_5652/g.13023  ORF Transcript_5652/g.13023 Transcript_5652/m.13023 type:complete len:99 (+) Transcript_5652:52-348(+)
MLGPSVPTTFVVTFRTARIESTCCEWTSAVSSSLTSNSQQCIVWRSCSAKHTAVSKLQSLHVYIRGLHTDQHILCLQHLFNLLSASRQLQGLVAIWLQ